MMPQSKLNEKLRAARQYSQRGWKVVRLHGVRSDRSCECGNDCGKSAGKHPNVGPSWQTKATDEQETIERWLMERPTCNIGVQLGERSGIVDVEFDGDQGRELADRILADCCTPTYSSGRSVHRLFQWDVSLPKQAVLKVRGLEIRIGGDSRGAQSVFPPSRHHSGHEYEWLPGLSPDDVQVQPVPGELLGLIAQLEVEGNAVNGAMQIDDVELAHLAIEALSPKRADEYDEWLRVGMAAKSVSDDLLPDWIRFSQRSAKYQDGECEAKWPTFKRNGVGIASLIHWAREDGWTPPKREQRCRRDNRHEIVVTTDEYLVNQAAVEALSDDKSVFQRGGSLVQVVRAPGGEFHGIERPSDSPQIVNLPQSITREKLTANGRFVKLTKRGDEIAKVPTNPPDWCVKAVHERGQWPASIRWLNGIVEVPVLLADGSVLATPGYDSRSGLILEPREPLPEIPQRPTTAQVRAARDLVLDLVGDFPFETEAHRAAWLAYFLTALSRHAFRGPAPLFLVDANVRGSGKTLLCELVGQAVTGRELPRMSNPKDDDECRKRITALAMCGDSLVLIDNIAAELGCASLDAALTASVWKDRVLGRSEIVTFPLIVTWAASGNNVILRGDTSRRVCHIRLDSREENPEEREGFRIRNIVRHVHENRMLYIAAGLTILRGYCAAGRPHMVLKPWGSFEAWSELPRSAVVWCGLPDPGETRQELRAQSDRDAMALRALLDDWEALESESTGLTTGDALKRLADRPETHSRLAEIICDLCNSPAGKLPSPRQLGKRLQHLRKRVCGGKWLDSKPARGGYLLWSVYSQAESGEFGDCGESAEILRGCAGAHTREDVLPAWSETLSPNPPHSPDDDWAAIERTLKEIREDS